MTPPGLQGLNWQKLIWVKLTALYWYLSILPTRRIGVGRLLFQDLNYLILSFTYYWEKNLFGEWFVTTF